MDSIIRTILRIAVVDGKTLNAILAVAVVDGRILSFILMAVKIAELVVVMVQGLLGL